MWHRVIFITGEQWLRIVTDLLEQASDESVISTLISFEREFQWMGTFCGHRLNTTRLRGHRSQCPCWPLSSAKDAYSGHASIKTGLSSSRRRWSSLMSFLLSHVDSWGRDSTRIHYMNLIRGGPISQLAGLEGYASRGHIQMSCGVQPLTSQRCFGGRRGLTHY